MLLLVSMWLKGKVACAIRLISLNREWSIWMLICALCFFLFRRSIWCLLLFSIRYVCRVICGACVTIHNAHGQAGIPFTYENKTEYEKCEQKGILRAHYSNWIVVGIFFYSLILRRCVYACFCIATVISRA